jgi:hypothetical protein
MRRASRLPATSSASSSSRSVHPTFSLSRADALYMRQGQDVVLNLMNMPNNTLETPQIRERLEPIEQRLEEANTAWAQRTPIARVVDVILQLPVRFRTQISLKGYTMGSLVHEILQRNNGDRRVLEGLLFSGNTRDYGTEVYQTAPVRVPSDSDRWYTPKRIRKVCDRVSIRMFPLSKVVPHRPQVAPHDDSFTAFLEELTNTEGGSDLSCYMFWEDCYIFRMHRPPAYMTTQVRAVRTGALGNIITSPLTLKKCFMFKNKHQDVFIPDGEKNCFLSALEWGIFKHKWSTAEERFNENPFTAFYDITGVSEASNSDELEVSSTTGLDDVGMMKKALKAHTRTEVRQMMEEAASAINKVDADGKRSRSRSNKRRRLEDSYGLSTQIMNRYVVYFYGEYKYIIRLLYEKEANRLRNRLLDPSVDHHHQTPGHGGAVTGYIDLFQINDKGYILSNITPMPNTRPEEDPSSNTPTSKLVHCVCLWPGYLHSTTTSDVKDKLEKVTAEAFQGFYQYQSLFGYSGYFTEDSWVAKQMEGFVDYQNKRYSNKQTKTLIFNEKFKGVADDMSKASELHTKRKLAKRGGLEPNRVMVFAFDLETVPNKMSLQSRVFTPLQVSDNDLAGIPPQDVIFMEPSLGEIPFSAQWVPVNTSDIGKYADLKAELLTDNGTLCNISDALTTFHIAEDLMPETLDVSVAEHLREYASDFILSPPVTEYGDDQFGKCIDDMLVHMAEFAKSSERATDIYAYAHNGHHFDHYLVLLYNYRWPVVRLLLTPRGVLSATIQVSLGPNKDDVVRIHLRDTVLHMDGSLDALCAGFKVPKAWKKIDFPIRMVNAGNCYKPEIKEICRPYGENDVKALAYIIVKINQQIGELDWQPANPFSNRPPIAQFLTSMGVVRQSTFNHFQKVTKYPEYVQMYEDFETFRPNAVDVPALRLFIEGAAMGGRVCCMAKSYASLFWGEIIEAYLNENTSELVRLYHNIRETKSCMAVLDVTSLYPTVQSYCPMPLGGLRFIDKVTCEAHIDGLHCEACDAQFSLCPKHKYTFSSPRYELRPFSIITVRNVVPRASARANLYTLCGRKLYSPSNRQPSNIDYSLEDNSELFKRYNSEGVIPQLQSYTNVDLYWMRRGGWEFEVVCGMEFDVSMTYNSFIEPAFQKRIEAKIAGNKLQSLALKKMYNGSYGVTIQKDITDGHSLVTLPVEMRDRSVLEPDIVSHLVRNDCLDASEKLTGEAFMLRSGQTLIKKVKAEGVGEYYADQSPLQIGAAILAYARHLMNLVMFNINQTEQTYTDTDSDCVSENVYNTLATIPGLINNRDDAPMGSFKNDHAENNGTEPRVVFALYATKKAKLYVTLNLEGQMRIFNTFKGLKPSSFVDGKKMNPEHAEYIISKSLFEIGVSGTCESQMVTSWKRSLSSGITISDHWQRMESATYLGHAQGTKLVVSPQGNTEFFIPFGSTVVADFPIIRTITPQQEDLYEFVPLRERSLGRIWNAEPTLVSSFLEKYYASAHEEYVSDDPKYAEILEAFRSVVSSN